jgi:PE family
LLDDLPMSYVSVVPEFVSDAARQLSDIESAISDANAAAAAYTTSMVAAGEDEVSTNIAAILRAQALAWEEYAARVAAARQDFNQVLGWGADAYAAAEAANTNPLQTIEGV